MNQEEVKSPRRQKARESRRVHKLGTHFVRGWRSGRYTNEEVARIADRTPWRDRWVWTPEYVDQPGEAERIRIESAGFALLTLCARGGGSQTWFARVATEDDEAAWLFGDEALQADGWQRKSTGEWVLKEREDLR